MTKEFPKKKLNRSSKNLPHLQNTNDDQISDKYLEFDGSSECNETDEEEFDFSEDSSDFDIVELEDYNVSNLRE